MKKTPADLPGNIDQAEGIVPLFTKSFFHFLREMEEQKLAEWVSEEEMNKQLFNELTDQKEVQKNLAEIDSTEIRGALNRCLKKIHEEKL